MKRTYMLLAWVLLCYCSISGVEADEYLIGTYSQWRVDYENDPIPGFSNLRQKLFDAGFNAVNFTVKEEYNFSTAKLGAALSSLHNGGTGSVRTILSDFSWKSDLSNNKIGAYSLYGNYLQMEAEYQLKYENGSFVPDVLPSNDTTGDDAFNSVFKHDTGALSDYDINTHQIGYAWICDESSDDVAGLALSYPRFRWKPDDKANPRTIGYDLKFRKLALIENKLYITVALKFECDSPNMPIADIKFKVLKYTHLTSQKEWDNYDESDYYEFPLYSVTPAAYSTTIYNRDYPSVGIDGKGNYLFEYYIELPLPPNDTDPASLYTQLMGEGEFFYHLNPQVYWHGNGRLEIDYLKIQDKFQRTIDADGATNVYWGRLQTRMNQINELDTNNNILYHHLMDEPFQGQFKMYGLIQDYLETQGKDVITATTLQNSWLKKPNGHSNYSHFKLFLDKANPNTIALDSYPLQEWNSAPTALIKWDDVSDARFVQKRIQDITIDHYLELAKSIKGDNSAHSDTKLIFIPQIFGERVPSTSGGTAFWRYMMPPRSMISCLQLLPLCYAADGIVSFAIASNPTTLTEGYYRVAPLKHMNSLLSLEIDPYSDAYAYLTDANTKIAKYGPLIRNLDWRTADAIMVDGLHPSLNLADFQLANLSVVHSGDDYEGYVQCGYYWDNNSCPSFMMVNRRSVFKTTLNPNDVVQVPVDNSFVDAPSQTVQFELSASSYSVFGTHVALCDVYDSSVVFPTVSEGIMVTNLS